MTSTQVTFNQQNETTLKGSGQCKNDIAIVIYDDQRQMSIGMITKGVKNTCSSFTI